MMMAVMMMTMMMTAVQEQELNSIDGSILILAELESLKTYHTHKWTDGGHVHAVMHYRPKQE